MQILTNKCFVCEICNFTCIKKGDYKRHLTTKKHQKNENNSKIKVNESENNNNVNDKDLVMTLLKENNEFKQIITDLLKNGTHNTNNSHNKTFNLNFFLNDTCKDAINIADFVKSIQIQLKDLEKMGEIGYVSGISDIIVKNLKDMDITSRPIHCTDIKRETLYVKEDDKWLKETDDKVHVKKVIKEVAHKNSRVLMDFKNKNPDYNNSSSRISDKYNKLLVETMGGAGNNDEGKESKIIKNIAKEIVIDKLSVV